MTSLERDPKTLAHTDDPDTSHAAARAPGKATNRFLVARAYFMRGPSTSFHVWLYGNTPGEMDLAEVRRRTTDLLQMGYLRRTGRKEIIALTRKQACVLELTAEGRALFQETP